MRLFSGAPEFSEGWAFYCERMMKEPASTTRPPGWYIVHTDAIWRATRIILDIQLHRGVIGFDEAVDRLVAETGFERPAALAEVKRYTSTPTYQLSYLFGRHMIERLKARRAGSRGRRLQAEELPRHAALRRDDAGQLRAPPLRARTADEVARRVHRSLACARPRGLRRGADAEPGAGLPDRSADRGLGPGHLEGAEPPRSPSAGTEGEFTIELYGDQAPIATANFVALARCGFYDGIRFHRVLAGFVIQAGDPGTKAPERRLPGLGTGGPGYQFEIEPPAEGMTYAPYAVAMANAAHGRA